MPRIILRFVIDAAAIAVVIFVAHAAYGWPGVLPGAALIIAYGMWCFVDGATL